METRTGDGLRRLAAAADALERRDSFPRLAGYMRGEPCGKACILNGLRRTGKTVMMLQAAMDDPKRSAYILCNPEDDIPSLCDMIDDLKEKGIDRFFIDEITCLSDFIDNCQSLADIGCADANIAITGTDSLSFAIAGHTSLSGRAIEIRTTRIPFAEHARLLGTESLDEYARRGGILADFREFSDYPLEAIALNIQNSLLHYGHGDRFASLAGLHRSGMLTAAIRNVVHDENHKFTMDVLRREWDIADFSQGRANIRDAEARRWAGRLKAKDILAESMERLDIASPVRLPKDRRLLHEINQWLQKLDLIEPLPVLTEADLSDPGRDLSDLLLRERLRESHHGRWVFTQPGLRWGEVDAILKSIERRALANGLPGDRLAAVFKAVRDHAMGHVMEDIVISETAAALGGDAIVFKYQPLVGDIDMAIADGNGLRLFGIKHSASPRDGWLEHIRDGKSRRLLEARFGKIRDEGVIYTGAAREPDFVNAADYLKQLRKAPEKPAARKRQALRP